LNDWAVKNQKGITLFPYSSVGVEVGMELRDTFFTDVDVIYLYTECSFKMTRLTLTLSDLQGLLFVNGLTQHPLDEDQTKFHLDFK
jgi:hypothetical protein